MLKLVKESFRGLFVVFLWLNLFGSVITGCILGSKGGGGLVLLGIVAGVLVGIFTDILCGGLVATFLSIEDKLDGLDNKYTASLRLLERIGDSLGRIEQKTVLSPVKSKVPNEDDGIKPELNAVYDAVITRIVALGAFAEYLPGKIGMIAITEISLEIVVKVDDVLKVGDKVRVKVIGFERSGSAKLSIKALL